MKYMVPFAAVKSSLKLVSTRGQLRVDSSYDELLLLVKKFLLSVEVDELWYRKLYPDVDEAIRNGLYPDAKTHFIAEGYFEGRRPYSLEVDPDYYLRTNPDVRLGIESGDIASVNDHFEKYGYDEGRLPAAPIP